MTKCDKCGKEAFTLQCDLVMWTKNGADTLFPVLNRINAVVPSNSVNQRIIVDDASRDGTVAIAKACGWDVVPNSGRGISDGANTALDLVETEFFCSFEQDLLLAKDWFPKVVKHMTEGVACVQGLRLTTVPTMRILEQEELLRRKHEYVSMDNNLFRTSVIRNLGGFPRGCPVCTDTILRNRIHNETDYKWIILPDLISCHIRQSVMQQILHSYRLSQKCSRTPLCSSNIGFGLMKILRLFLTSPIRGLEISLKRRLPSILFYYPYVRFCYLCAELQRVIK